MSLETMALLFFAGLLSGVVNAIAGGGTFLTFGALSIVGIPPVLANATSSVTQLPGYITSTLAYWSDIKQFWRGALMLCAVSAIGAVVGALTLLALDNPAFRAMVPWLLIAATIVFAVGPWLKPKPRPGQEPNIGSALAAVIQFVTAVYGGFFGAGMGVMMLATLGLTQSGDYHRLNALKNLLSIVIAIVAIIIFVGGGVVAWPQATVMVPGVALGGYLGVQIAKRVPQAVVRVFVIGVGLALACFYYYTG